MELKGYGRLSGGCGELWGSLGSWESYRGAGAAIGQLLGSGGAM